MSLDVEEELSTHTVWITYDGLYVYIRCNSATNIRNLQSLFSNKITIMIRYCGHLYFIEISQSIQEMEIVMDSNCKLFTKFTAFVRP